MVHMDVENRLELIKHGARQHEKDIRDEFSEGLVFIAGHELIDCVLQEEGRVYIAGLGDAYYDPGGDRSNAIDQGAVRAFMRPEEGTEDDEEFVEGEGFGR